MYLIGLTGGIASGKSTVARRLYEHGAVVIDADELARRVVEPGTPALAAIAEQFGATLVLPNGALDRGALGAIVFRDPAALDRLNAITHPAVRKLAASLIDELATTQPDAVVVYDVPLLVEASVDHPFDLVVVTDAPRRTQLERLVNERGLDPVQAAARIDAQASRDERLAVADVVIDTDGTLGHTMSQVDALWARIAGERRAAAGTA